METESEKERAESVAEFSCSFMKRQNTKETCQLRIYIYIYIYLYIFIYIYIYFFIKINLHFNYLLTSTGF